MRFTLIFYCLVYSLNFLLIRVIADWSIYFERQYAYLNHMRIKSFFDCENPIGLAFILL